VGISVDAALSGMLAAQRAAQVAGHNIMNANTPGYRRQKLELRPGYPITSAIGSLGRGVDIDKIVGQRDFFLFAQLLDGQGSLAHSELLSGRLAEIEAAIGSDPEAGINQSINRFFDALNEVETNPDRLLAREILINSASTLAENISETYNRLAQFRTNLSGQHNEKVIELNETIEQIADLNKQIRGWQNQGFDANDFIDRRDELIRKVGKIMGVQVVRQENETVNVLFDGGMLASDWTSFSLETATVDDELRLRYENDTTTFRINDGELGAIGHLHDDLIPGYLQDLDDLASALIQTVNAVHATGVGLDGGMSTLSSSNTISDADGDGDPANDVLSSCDLPFDVTAGTLRISVTDTATGEVTQTNVAIDPSTDTLATLTAKLAAVEHINAATSAGRITILAEPGHKFDFSRRLDANPPDLGTAALEIGGVYTGIDNDTFTMVATASGTVGTTGSLQVTAFDADGNALGSYDIGSDYNPGQWIDGPEGVKFKMAAGNITTAQVVSTNTDTFDLSAQGTIDVSVNGAAAQTVNLNNADFFDVSQASTQSVVNAINAQAGLQGAGFTASVTANGEVRIDPAVPGGTITLEDGGVPILAALGLADGDYVGGVTSNAGPFDLTGGGSFIVYDDDPGKTTPYTINLNFDDLYDMTAVAVADLAAVIEAQTTNVDVSVVGGSLRLASDAVALDMSIQITDGGNNLTGAIGLSTSLAQADQTSFTVSANMGTDTSGILVALGLNGFFKGSGATNIGVDDRITNNPRLFAAAVADPPGDNLNVTEMLKLQQQMTVGGTQTFNQAFASFIGAVGNDAAKHNNIHDAQLVLEEGLMQRIDAVSGVSLDEEVANLMIFQQAFQASARVMTTLNVMLEALVNM